MPGEGTGRGPAQQGLLGPAPQTPFPKEAPGLLPHLLHAQRAAAAAAVQPNPQYVQLGDASCCVEVVFPAGKNAVCVTPQGRSVGKSGALMRTTAAGILQARARTRGLRGARCVISWGTQLRRRARARCLCLCLCLCCRRRRLTSLHTARTPHAARRARRLANMRRPLGAGLRGGARTPRAGLARVVRGLWVQWHADV